MKIEKYQKLYGWKYWVDQHAGDKWIDCFSWFMVGMVVASLVWAWSIGYGINN